VPATLKGSITVMPMARSVVSEVVTIGLPEVVAHPDIVFANIDVWIGV
jgi:hypothetical protein